MTQDEIMEMAKESGLEQMLIYLKDFEAPKKALETFAALLTSKYHEYMHEYLHEEFYYEINEAILKEREDCIEACRKTITSQRSAWGANFCIEAIKARGQA